MKHALTFIALLCAVACANAQQSAAADSASLSGASAVSQGPGTSNVTQTFNTVVPDVQTVRTEGGLTTTMQGTTTQNQNLSGGTTSTINGTTTSNQNVNYSGRVENVASGTQTLHTVADGFTTNNQNVNYSGSQTIRNVPSIAMSGPASGPCTGASGGIGLAWPGAGIGINGASVEPSCVLRENIRVTGMAMQSLGGDNPQEMGEVRVMMMDQLRGLNKLSQTFYPKEKQ